MTIPNSVTQIGEFAFRDCYTLSQVIIGSGVVSIGDYAFYGCPQLGRVYFRGNMCDVGLHTFEQNNATVYYLPGTDWNSTFGGRPTALWFLPKPELLTLPPYFGLKTNAFGFRISWATNAAVVVEAATSLNGAPWVPVSSNRVFNGWCYFRDVGWSNYPARFYRVRSL